jgi:hypothetical protein
VASACSAPTTSAVRSSKAFHKKGKIHSHSLTHY